MQHIQIAIDGPSGAGKSTISKAIAARLGIVYVDTGALYRTVGYYARSQGISLPAIAAVVDKLSDIHVEVRYVDGVQNVFLNGENLGDRIRENEISLYASAVGALPPVRAFLLDTQQRIARENSVIMDGRDIGTVVLPDAELKVFLTASAEARAQRRLLELEHKGVAVSFAEVLRDIEYRDEQDTSRAAAPLKRAEDAVLLDTSSIDFDESLSALSDIITRRLGVKAVDAE